MKIVIDIQNDENEIDLDQIVTEIEEVLQDLGIEADITHNSKRKHKGEDEDESED